MKILLLGCTGFIGKELIIRLIEDNFEIYVVSRKNINSLKRDIPINKIKFLKLDLSVRDNWQNPNIINYLNEAEGIINLMGEPIADKRWNEIQKKVIENSRIQTTEYLMDTLRKLQINPKVIINGSAVGFYGTSLSDQFNENSSAGKDFLANLCERWEKAAYKKPFFTRLVILRIGIVLGENGGALGKMLPIFRTGFGGPIGKGDQWMSWIHRTDLCRLIIIALKEKRFSGIYNAVAPEPVKMQTFTNTLASCLKSPNLIPVPEIMLKILIGDGAKMVLEGQKVVNTKIKNSFFRFDYPLLEGALFALTKK